ncbi:MAG: DUF1326 domain-containing protein [Tepidisphaerales bacterium]
MRSNSLAFVACVLVMVGIGPQARADAEPEWAASITNIEACSCPLMCQCYFNPQPALHEEGGKAMRYCRFNNAMEVKQGHWGDTKLDGVKFWMAGDLGGDFSKGQMEWAVLTFESSATPQQRVALKGIIGHVFPVKWNSFTDGPDAKIELEITAAGATARLDGGKSGEVRLNKNKGPNGEPIVLKNVAFWAAPQNDGFTLARNEIEAYRLGPKAFEFSGTTGFITVFTMASKDVRADAGGKADPDKALATSFQCPRCAAAAALAK